MEYWNSGERQRSKEILVFHIIDELAKINLPRVCHSCESRNPVISIGSGLWLSPE